METRSGGLALFLLFLLFFHRVLCSGLRAIQAGLTPYTDPYTMNLPPGSRLGRYEVRSLLGVGGMGEVYLAYDHDLEREVAVRVLGDGERDSEDRTRRFSASSCRGADSS